MTRWHFVMLAASLACASGACSEGDMATAGGGMDDGKVRPPPNGVPISEAEACDIMQGAFQSRASQLGCAVTVRTCPSFVRVLHDPDCVQYDQGSAQGCADHYNGAMACGELQDDSCVATVYPGSEPAGCP